MGVMKSLATARMFKGSRGGLLSFNTAYYFDVALVKTALQRHERKYLAWVGSYTRTTARRSIKRMGYARPMPHIFTRRGRSSKAFQKWLKEAMNRPASPPGTPVHTHTGFFRRAVEFVFDFAKKSVLIGYAYSIQNASGKPMKKLAHVHEYGGVRFRRKYPARPTMHLAFQKTIPKMAGFWKDALRHK